jgi:environmental stress-induced protein Ves
MSAVTIIPATSFREGRWLNGMGVSWDIAVEPPGAGVSDFGWRFAIARIDSDVPFSRYQDVDRVFTLIEGQGLDLEVAGHGRIAVHERFIPHEFPGDAATTCALKAGPCRALNLFMRRGQWRGGAGVSIGGTASTGRCDTALIFALRGNVTVLGKTTSEGNAAIAGPGIAIASASPDTIFYMARLYRH